MCESYVQPYWKPLRSPFWSTSTSRVYGGSGRAVTPKLSIECSPVGGRGMSITPPKRLAMALVFLVLAFVAGGGLPGQAGLKARVAAVVGGPHPPPVIF